MVTPLVQGPTARDQLRSTWPTLLAIVGVCTVLLGAVLVVSSWKGVPCGTLTRDPAAVAGVPYYTGCLSNVGIFFWAAAAAVCAFSAAALRDDGDARDTRAFMLASGAFSLVVGLDDALLLHEDFFNDTVGIPQQVVLATYAILFCVYLLFFFKTIGRTDWVVLALAGAFFAVAMALDALEPSGLDPAFFEDGAKLVGQVSWLAYFFGTGLAAVRTGAAPAGTSSPDRP